MKLTPTTALSAVEQCCRRLAESLPQNRSPLDQATLVAQVLHELGPASPLVACQVWNGRSHLHVVDDAGQPRAAWATALTAAFQQPANDLLPLMDSVALPGQVLVIEHQEWRDSPCVVVAAALPADHAGDELTLLRGLLSICGRLVVPHVVLQAHDRHLAKSQEELAAEQATADLGALAQPLAHEFNNFLNNLMLQLAVLEHQLGDSFRAKSVQLRQLGTETAALVKRYQQYRQRLTIAPQPVNLNQVLREVCQALLQPGSQQSAPPGPQVKLQLTSDLPNLLGPVADFRRCCTFLIANAGRAMDTGVVSVRTELANQRLLLHVEDEGPTVAEDDLHRLFEPNSTTRPGTEPLELAACQSLVRRLGGRLNAVNRPEKGIRITVDFPAPRE